MTKREVKEYLKVNANKSVYMADELTNSGYGQTIGQYHNAAKKCKVVNPTQKWHFVESYCKYMKNVDGLPTYSRLHCPELLLWIAEVAGLNERILCKAIECIISFEEKNHLKGTEKGGLYIRPIEKEFKTLLHIYEINRIIRDSMDWAEVTDKVGSIK